MSSSTCTFRVRSTWTTLGYMPSGSCSSFCTRFSLPSLDISAPGICRENRDLSSSTEKRDRERRMACAAAGVGASPSESDSSFFSSGQRVGHSVVSPYLFKIACSKLGSMAAACVDVCGVDLCWSSSGGDLRRGMRPPITAARRLAEAQLGTSSQSYTLPSNNTICMNKIEFIYWHLVLCLDGVFFGCSHQTHYELQSTH
jgi:hypothetical protein